MKRLFADSVFQLTYTQHYSLQTYKQICDTALLQHSIPPFQHGLDN